MSKILIEEGFDVEILTGLPNYPTGKIFSGYIGKVLMRDEYDQIKVRRHWLYPSNSKNPILRIISMVSFSFSIFLSFFYLKFKRRPDITIINSPPLFTGVAGLVLSKTIGSKTVVNISDIWPLSALELGAIKKGKFYSFLEKMESFIYKNADACIGQSNETLTHIKNQQPAKSTFLYRNLDLPSKYIHQGAAYDRNKIKIVYAGLLGVAQGVFNICKTIDFEKLGVELHIYGGGNEEEKIIEYIKANPNCNIYFHGFVDKSEIPSILKTFHATLIPLVNPIYGAFPSKIFMAIASGLPILFSGEGEGAEVVKKYNLGWVNPSDEILKLKQNIIELKEVGTDNYNNIKNNCIAAGEGDFNIGNQNLALINFIRDFSLN